MGAGLPSWLGYVVGATIFVLASAVLGTIAVYAWLEERRQQRDERQDRE
jgi:hypothetical protein